MKTFEVYDHVSIKQDPSLYGTVQRTNSDAYDALEDELIIAHTEVPPDILNEFVVSGIPPVGYVFVQFADEVAGSSLVSEDDLVLQSRSFQIGDSVRRAGIPLTGSVIDVSENYILEPISARQHVAERLSSHLPPFPTCTTECEVSLPPYFTHPNPHLLLYNVPSREVKRAQDVIKDDFIVYGDWVGVVEEVEYDIFIALEDKTVMVLTGMDGLHIAVPDYKKPLVALPEFDDFKRPDMFGATQGWANTIPVQEPRPGYSVIIDRSRLRHGRWVSGSYSHNSPSHGVVIDVRARVLSVDWVSTNAAPGAQPEAESLPYPDIMLYENIGTFRDPTSLRRKKGVIVYDPGKMPVKSFGEPSGPEAQPRSTGQPSQKDIGGSRPVCTAQDMAVGFQVKFRDPTAAAVKYQGSKGSSHGKFLRLPPEAFGGWDLNEFRIVYIQQEVSVLWQDGTITNCDSKMLRPFVLFETELAPTDIVLKREGMRQRPVFQENNGSNDVKDFNEMTFFERPHDLLPQSVGVVQTVDPTDRVARVRWYKAPKIELRGSGQSLAIESRFGPIGDRTEEVSLYEIMTFPSLMRRRKDLCIVAPSEHSEKRANGTRSVRNKSRGSNIGASIASRLGLGLDSLVEAMGGAEGKDSTDTDSDWIGQIVEMRLDGTFTVRLGASTPCRDRVVDADAILTIIDDREYMEEFHDHEHVHDHEHDLMDVDSWAGTHSDWSDERNADPISESVEYEGGARLDNDSGDENWISDENEEFQDAEEQLRNGDADSPMVDGPAQQDDPSVVRKSEPPLMKLQQTIGSEAPPQFLVLDREPAGDQFGLHHSSNAAASFLKRISREHRILATSLPQGEIYVRTYESRLDLLRCLIVGPKDTPYENAPFLIDLFLPENFPNEPPTAHFHSWTSGLGRVNPNLYEEGKICLSLLGTWSGKHETEKWSDKATILQLLVSLQGLVFVKKPFYNEAGFEGYENDPAYTRESEQYSEKAFVMARGFVKHALSRPPGGMEDVLAWLYLPRDCSNLTSCLLGTVVQRARSLMQKSEKSRLDQDDSLMDAAGGAENQTQVFLRPLSRGAVVMLGRLIGELQSQLDQVTSVKGPGPGLETQGAA